MQRTILRKEAKRSQSLVYATYYGIHRTTCYYGIWYVVETSLEMFSVSSMLSQLVGGTSVTATSGTSTLAQYHDHKTNDNRGNWRKESTSAPSLLTKSCHDIDFLMWMLCSPSPSSLSPPHLPSLISSTGSLKYFRKSRKPLAAGSATNCLSCVHETSCSYSAKKIYVDKHLAKGNADWPVKIVNAEIEDIFKTQGKKAAEQQLLSDLGEDYDEDTPEAEVQKRNWFGRCVWESDNNVCDDQVVTLTWEDEPTLNSGNADMRGSKTALFHMIAHTEKQCERRGRIYGTHGEIEYDSTAITIHDFATNKTTRHVPHAAGGGHGGGDAGLARQFLMAVNAVDKGNIETGRAQREFLGCDLEEAFRSHAVVFAADDARTGKKVVDWGQWWSDNVKSQLRME